MDAKTEVPEIKLSKVGKDRERKKGGAGWLGQGAGNSGFAGAVGGSGEAGSAFLSFFENAFGRSLAALLPKLLIGGMVGCMGLGALAVGKAVKAAGQRNVAGASQKPKTFAAKEAKPEASAGIQKTDAVQNGMMAFGSLDGKTQAERDAEAAAAKAAADKAAADQAKASAPPPEQPDAKAAPAGPMDPAAMAAAAAKGAGAEKDGKKEGEGKKGFGSFSSQLGGAAHGASLSSGFGFGKSMDGAGRLGGSRSFGNMHATDSRTSSQLARGVNPGSGRARRQLGLATQLSNAASRSGNAETMAQNAQNAFQAPVGGNEAITGGGAGTNGAGGGGSGGGSNPSLSGDTGSYVPDDCGALFPDGGYVSTGSGGCACPPGMDGDGKKCSSVSSGNATPGQSILDIAKMLIIIASICLLLAMILGLMANALDSWFGIGEAVRAVAHALCAIAMVCAGIATLLGISLWAMGGSMEGQGQMYTILGGIMTAGAAIAYMGTSDTSEDSTESANQAATQDTASQADQDALDHAYMQGFQDGMNAGNPSEGTLISGPDPIPGGGGPTYA
jgi:hypothetical protein